MELDNFKKMMDASTSIYKPENNNIMELINNKSRGPLAKLERNLKSALFLFPLTALVFVAVFINNSLAYHSLSMWLLLAILFIEFISSLFNYGIVKKLQRPTGNTKKNMIAKVRILGKDFKRHFVMNACLYVVMAVMLEIAMYYHIERNYEGWYGLPFLLRTICYIGFLIFQFFLKKYFYKKQFGQYFEELNNLVQQLQ
jgi:hypothetical protein